MERIELVFAANPVDDGAQIAGMLSFAVLPDNGVVDFAEFKPRGPKLSVLQYMAMLMAAKRQHFRVVMWKDEDFEGMSIWVFHNSKPGEPFAIRSTHISAVDRSGIFHRSRYAAFVSLLTSYLNE